MTTVGIVTGLQKEAEVAANAGGLSACHGPGVDAARTAALTLIEHGADALVSFGVCGGLHPDLRTGQIVVPASIVSLDDPACRFETDGGWRANIPTALFTPIETLATSRTPLMTVAQKTDAGTHADAIDMESVAIAEAADSAGVPFMVLRAVADERTTVIPATALSGMQPDGSTSTGAVLKALMKAPHHLPGLIRAGRDFGQAMAALRRVAAAAGPGFWISV